MGFLDNFKIATMRLQANLSAFELSNETLFEKYGIEVYTLDVNNDEQVKIWCDIINHSYSEFDYNVESARAFLRDETYYHDAVTYLFKNANGGYWGTVSIAKLIASPKVGADFKIGIKKDLQGQGFGRLIILYAFSRLRELGYEIGEACIKSTRDVSLHLHFKLGFRPQFNPHYFALPSSSKLFALIKFWPLLKLRIAYKNFIDKENKKFKCK